MKEQAEVYRKKLEQKAEERGLPDHTTFGLIRYILHGCVPGGFLTAVLKNELWQSFSRADLENRDKLWYIVKFLYNDAPADCWGGEGEFEDWVAKGGLVGKTENQPIA